MSNKLQKLKRERDKVDEEIAEQRKEIAKTYSPQTIFESNVKIGELDTKRELLENQIQELVDELIDANT